MNLGQAVAVCLYELASSSRSFPAEDARQTASPGRNNAVPASSGDLDLVAEVVAQTMQAANHSPTVMQTANGHDLDLLLRRLKLDRRDARRILGLFRRILWRLKR